MTKLINDKKNIFENFQNASVSVQHVLFAVKTWSKNHADRVPIIQRTWARQTKFVRYFSDTSGKKMYSNSLNMGTEIIIFRLLCVRSIDSDNKYKCRKYRNRSLYQDVNNLKENYG